MTFLPVEPDRTSFGDGDKNSKIAIVGEIASKWEQQSGRIFSGPVGTTYEQCLHSAKLTRADVYATNIVKRVGKFEMYYKEKKGVKSGYFTEAGQEYVEDLEKEINSLGCNIVIAMGEAASMALIGRDDVMGSNGCRGYIFPCRFNPDLKVMPTIHPRKVTFDYILRHYIAHDMMKAGKHSHERGLTYDLVDITIARSFIEARELLINLNDCPILSIDIEVKNYEVSCIGFAPDPNTAYVIPFYGKNLYTLQQEVELWLLIARIMGNTKLEKIGQNFIFDMQFLLGRYNIHTQGKVHDTMVRHSIAFPEFFKGLNFLASIYCNSPYWKDMVHWKKAEMIKSEA